MWAAHQLCDHDGENRKWLNCPRGVPCSPREWKAGRRRTQLIIWKRLSLGSGTVLRSECPKLYGASNHPGSCANADYSSGCLVICNSGDFQVLLLLLLVLGHFWGRKVPRSEHCRFLPEVWSVDHSIHGSSLEMQVTRPCPDWRAVGSGCGPTYVCLTNCPRGFRCAEV